MKQYGERFLFRCFTAEEIAYCQEQRYPERHYAARFAAKEAVAKAIGTGIGSQLGFHDMYILRGPSGPPYVKLSDEAAQRFGHPQIVISMSHCETYATAVAYLTDKLGVPPPSI
jgi:holo-[acyl-carrier protein] synthase